MSQIALFMALLLLPLHACNARNTFAFVSYTKDAEKITLHKTDHVKVFPVSDTEEALLGRKTRSVMDNLDKNQRAMGMKDMMENARTLVESASHETKEATHAHEDESMGDVVVTDYVQPHRKSPIHNRH